MSQLIYNPPPSTVPYLTGDKFVNLIVGPVGSTKTTASIMKIAYEAKRIAPCRDGIRRSRTVVVRGTNQQLEDTTIPDFLKWFGEAGVYTKTGKRFIMRFDDVEAEILFRGLEDANDVRRLLSLQLSYGFMDEFAQIPMDIFYALQGRLGRYPDKSMNGVGCCELQADGTAKQIHKVWGSTNAPDFGTPWEEYLSSPPANALVLFQPSGLSPEADWIQYLPDDYYDNLAEGKSQDWIDVYIHAKFGKSLAGQPVFRCFDRTIHVAKAPLTPLPAPVVIGVDAGLNPTAVITQQTYDGRLLVLDAITGTEGGMGALRFIREKLRPLLMNKYPRHTVVVAIDPAAFQRAQTDEKTVADIFKNEGLMTKPAVTNAIAARLAAGEAFMTRTVNGNQALVVDPGCADLIKSLAGMYRYKIKTNGETDDKPEKNHPWSDYCFPAGTLVDTPNGPKDIATLRPGDVVCTYDGVDVVTATGSREAETITLELTDGTKLTCTEDHPFAINNHTCFLRADALTSSHVLVTTEDGAWASGLWRTRASGRWCVRAYSAGLSLKQRLGGWLKEKGSTARESVTAWTSEFLMVLSSMACGSPGPGKIRTTGTSAKISGLYRYTGTCGSGTTGLYPMGMRSIMSTGTLQTMTSKTSNAFLEVTTSVRTWLSGMLAESSAYLTRLAKRLRNGTGHLKDVNGIGSMPTTQSVVAVKQAYRSGVKSVFNITTKRTHLFYVNGILVHNCDAFTYACLHHDRGASFGARLMAPTRRPVKQISAIGWT